MKTFVMVAKSDCKMHFTIDDDDDDDNCNCNWDIHVSQYCFKPHNICQVWTCHQSSLQRIQFMKSYKRDMGTAKFNIVHHFAYINSSFQEICSFVTHYALLSRFVVVEIYTLFCHCLGLKSYFRQLFCFYGECIYGKQIICSL